MGSDFNESEKELVNKKAELKAEKGLYTGTLLDETMKCKNQFTVPLNISENNFKS